MLNRHTMVRNSGLFRVPSGGVAEFLNALGRPFTWSPHRNGYFVLGFLWGVPIPLVTLGAQMWMEGIGLSPSGFLQCIREVPLQIAFLLHPLVFAALFGAFGTLARKRDGQITALLNRLEKEAMTDSLTGLLNHGAFQTLLRRETDRARREGSEISLMILDLDQFKIFNDKHGHQAGDRLLRSTSERFLMQVRPYDSVCRYGGEEFAIILPGLGAMAAMEVAERIRASQAGEGVTLSGGIATRIEDEPIPEWIERTDRLLYTAKAMGRNLVLAKSPPMDPAMEFGSAFPGK